MKEQNKKYFKENKHHVFRKIISEDALELLNSYVELQQERGYFEGSFFSKENTKYGDPIFEALMLELKPKIEEVVGEELLPSFAHMRIYKKGGSLRVHKDRPACEYAATLTVNYDSDEIWPIYITDFVKKKEFFLDRGDLLIIKGREVPHGRDQFTGNYWIQVFMNYVKKDGEFLQWKYDKREFLGPPKFKNNVAKLLNTVKKKFFKKKANRF